MKLLQLRSYLNRTILTYREYESRRKARAALRKRQSHLQDTLLDFLQVDALSECARFVKTHLEQALAFSDKRRLWDFALSKVRPGGLYAEFGVYKGESINYLSRRIGGGETIFGFDSFEGLKEDWRGHQERAGTFSLGGKLPRVFENVTLVKGWFDKTVPRFLDEHSQHFSFLHIDCDTFEAASLVLTLVKDRITSGTVVVFDEFFGYRGWRLGECKAWEEFAGAAKMNFEYLGFTDQQVAIRVN